MVERGQLKLVLMCGLPGAGKTTLAKRLADSMPAVRLCPDEWMAELGIDLYDEEARARLEAVFWRHTQGLLRLGQSVILEFGFWSRDERDSMRLGARALGASVELRYVTAPVDELLRRIAARARARTPGTAPVTGDMLREYLGVFEAPYDDEFALFDNPSR